MSETTAEAVILAGAAIGVVVWLLGAWAVRRASPEPGPAAASRAYPGRRPDDALRSLLRATGAGTWAIRERTDTHALLEITLPRGRPVRVVAKAEPVTGGARILLAADSEGGLRALRWTGRALSFGLTPLVVLGLPVLLWQVAAHSPDPDVRTQAVQVVQMVHVLWPPFLIAFLTRTLRGRLVASLDDLLSRVGLDDA